MHYDLGQKFRAHYVDNLGFLPSQFDPTKIYVRSTDVPRTLQSAEVSKLFFDSWRDVMSCDALIIACWVRHKFWVYTRQIQTTSK